MSEKKSSYQQIFKATSIFGGVQVFNILITIIRSKLVAILLGPAGMGIMGLLTSSISFISSATNFGLGTSAVRDIAHAYASGNQKKISETVAIFRKLVWITGFLGLFITIALSPLLSKISFGNYDYTLAFCAIAFTLLINQIASGQKVILQGLRKISGLAKANIFGSLASLIFTIPLYYFFGLDGIVPAIIVSALLILVVQFYFSSKVKFSSISVSVREAFQKGKPMMQLGLMLSLSGLISVGASYIIRIYISNIAGIEMVGFYSAGFTIINVYVGMVFSAMATDYYPRLSSVNDNVNKSNLLISQQSEIALMILAPLICIFQIFVTWVILLLYSEKFLPISGMIHWAMLGIFFKAVSWSIGYLILAKGDSKAFFWNELIANLYLLAFNIFGFYLGGLDGLGISFLVGYFIHLLQIFLFAKTKYGFNFEKGHNRIFVIFFLLGLGSFVLTFLLDGFYFYLMGILLICAVSFLSLKFLDQRTGIIEILINKLKNNGG